MRRFCAFFMACSAACVLLACGTKRPPPAVLDEGDDGGTTIAPLDAATPVDAGPEKVCTEIADASPREGCSCPVTYGMILTQLPCGFALCEDATNTAWICDYDATLRIIHNIDFSNCPLDGGALPLCGGDGG